MNFTQLASKADVLCEITRNNGHCRVTQGQRSLEFTDLGTDRKPVCDFLLVKNTNLYPISHYFRLIVTCWSNYCFAGVPLLKLSGSG